MKRHLSILMFAAGLCGCCFAQSTQTPKGLKEYVPILPSVRAHFWEIDPKLGYAMKSVGGGVYVITDLGWQSTFLVTDDGVIVFDAPESYGAKIPSAIASVPSHLIIYNATVS
jgi:hypothetical protein